MIYHLQCFTCDQCGKVLDSGDHYIVHENKILCPNHYPNHLSLSNSKNSSTELITDHEDGEIVVKTEQMNLNSSIDNQIGQFQSNSTSQSFQSLSSPTNSVMDHSFLLNRQTSASITSLPNNLQLPNNLSTINSLINSTQDHHHNNNNNLLPQPLSLIDYAHQPPSILNANNKTGLNEFDTQAADFYSQSVCYVPPNAQLPAPPNSHLMNNIYEQDALRFYNSSNCISQTNNSIIQSSAPTPNSPLNEIENTNTSPSNGVLNNNNARKGRPRKRKQIGLSSSANAG